MVFASKNFFLVQRSFIFIKCIMKYKQHSLLLHLWLSVELVFFFFLFSICIGLFHDGTSIHSGSTIISGYYLLLSMPMGIFVFFFCSKHQSYSKRKEKSIDKLTNQWSEGIVADMVKRIQWITHLNVTPSIYARLCTSTRTESVKPSFWRQSQRTQYFFRFLGSRLHVVVQFYNVFFFFFFISNSDFAVLVEIESMPSYEFVVVNLTWTFFL